MSGVDLTAVMDSLATAVQTALATDKHAYAYPVEDLGTGDAVVGYPQDPMQLTQTFARGMDRATFPVWIIGGLPQDKATRDTLADFITGSGSLVTAIEGYSTTAWSSVYVGTATIEEYAPNGRPAVLAVRFDCDVLSR